MTLDELNARIEIDIEGYVLNLANRGLTDNELTEACTLLLGRGGESPYDDIYLIDLSKNDIGIIPPVFRVCMLGMDTVLEVDFTGNPLTAYQIYIASTTGAVGEFKITIDIPPLSQDEIKCFVLESLQNSKDEFGYFSEFKEGVSLAITELRGLVNVDRESLFSLAAIDQFRWHYSMQSLYEDFIATPNPACTAKYGYRLR